MTQFNRQKLIDQNSMRPKSELVKEHIDLVHQLRAAKEALEVGAMYVPNTNRFFYSVLETLRDMVTNGQI